MESNFPVVNALQNYLYNKFNLITMSSDNAVHLIIYTIILNIGQCIDLNNSTIEYIKNTISALKHNNYLNNIQ